MKFEFLFFTAVIVGGGIYVHGPITPDLTYDVPTDVAYDMTSNMSLPEDFLRKYRAVPGAEIVEEREANKSVTWRFKENGRETGSFQVTLTPVSDKKTKVAFKYNEPKDEGAAFRAPSGGILPSETKPMLTAFGETAVREKLDSTLSKTRYDRRRVQEAVVAYEASHPKPVQVAQASATPAGPVQKNGKQPAANAKPVAKPTAAKPATQTASPAAIAPQTARPVAPQPIPQPNAIAAKSAGPETPQSAIAIATPIPEPAISAARPRTVRYQLDRSAYSRHTCRG
jgi:hypothetical protein